MLKLSLIGNLIKDAENSEVGATNVTKTIPTGCNIKILK